MSATIRLKNERVVLEAFDIDELFTRKAMSGRPKVGWSFQARITAAAMGTSVCVLLIASALFTLEQWSADRAR